MRPHLQENNDLVQHPQICPTLAEFSSNPYQTPEHVN